RLQYAFSPNAAHRSVRIEIGMVVEDQIGRLGQLCGHIQAHDIAQIAATGCGVNALGIAALQFVHRYAQVNLAVAGYILAVPALHLMEQRDRRADDVRALTREHAAETRIAHRRSAPAVSVMAEIFGDHLTQDIAVEENPRTPCRTQSMPQGLAEGRFTGAGESGDPIDAPATD